MMASYTPLDAPLSAIPDDAVFTPAQWETLLAISDVVVPALTTDTAPSKPFQKTVTVEEYDSTLATLTAQIASPDAAQIAKRYLSENASSLPSFKENLRRTFMRDLPQESLKGLCLILNALNTYAGSLLLTGSPTPIQNQPFDVREKIFQGWASSRLPPMRQINKSLIALAKRAWTVNSPTIPQVLGFPRVPIHGKPAESFDYQFLQFPPGDSNEYETIETDVVIVGSGCGGAVAAKNLAEAGHRVVVVEKAYHYPASYFPMTQASGLAHLYESGGAIMSDNGQLAILSGATWGGGGTINWGASLQTQNYVRQEWADTGLPFFTSPEFQTSLDRVCERMGVHTNYEQNFQNRMTQEGARKLGYSAHVIATNTGHEPHYDGHCSMGCHSMGKKGPVASWLVDAANAGAVFVEGFHAEKVLFGTVDGKRVAQGVEGVWTSRDKHLGTSAGEATRRKVKVKAKKVIVSCGSLQSPLLLMRSGIKNQHLGRNLYLHPVLISSAVFEEETRPWEGDCLTTFISDFENLDGRGHGTKVENMVMLPSLLLSAMPWLNGTQFKQLTARLNRMAGFIALTKEKEPGRVYADPISGIPRIDYTVSAFDRKSILEGLIAAAKIAFVSGASEFYTSYRDMRPFIRSTKANTSQTVDDADAGLEEGINDPEFQAWVQEFRKKSPLVGELCSAASAHQMGTCRMASSPRKGVVNPDGMVWGAEGLYVADASVFPSASGVNPMVTNMAITDWTSRKLAKAMNRDKVSQSGAARL